MTADRADQCFDEIWLKVSGVGVHCLTAGTSGPAVLLLHGSAFDAAGVSFGSAISALAMGCRVFAPDLPGFGESDPMPGGWGFADYSAFLSPLLTELGRDTRLILNAVAELEKYGVRVRSMTEEFDTATATGRLMLTMLSGFAARPHRYSAA